MILDNENGNLKEEKRKKTVLKKEKELKIVNKVKTKSKNSYS